MSTYTVSITYTHTVTYVTTKMLLSIKEVIREIGLERTSHLHVARESPSGARHIGGLRPTGRLIGDTLGHGRHLLISR